jgi:hypothetical protein
MWLLIFWVRGSLSPGLEWGLYVIRSVWQPSRLPLEESNRVRVCEPQLTSPGTRVFCPDNSAYIDDMMNYTKNIA